MSAKLGSTKTMAVRTRPLILCLALFSVLTSCKKRLPGLEQVTVQEQVYYSDASRWRDDAGTMRGEVIRGPEKWAEYWELITGSPEDRPAIDFDSHMLLLFNAGQMHPGDRIEIRELVPRDGMLIARYSVQESGIQESEVYPVQVVQVKRQSAEVRFEKMVNWQNRPWVSPVTDP